MTQHTAYSAANVVGTIDGRRISGLWDGDNSIEIAPMTERSSLLVGSDGSSITSRSTNRAATITVRVQHNSPTHRLLTQLDKRANAGSNIFFPVSITDTGSNEGGSAERVAIASAPTASMGANATVREWTLHTGEWVETVPDEAS